MISHDDIEYVQLAVFFGCISTNSLPSNLEASFSCTAPFLRPSKKSEIRLRVRLLNIAVAAFLPATLVQQVSCTGLQAKPQGIAQCIDYLTSIGTRDCVTYGGIATSFCKHGDAEIVAVGFGRVGVKTSSPW